MLTENRRWTIDLARRGGIFHWEADGMDVTSDGMFHGDIHVAGLDLGMLIDVVEREHWSTGHICRFKHLQPACRRAGSQASSERLNQLGPVRHAFAVAGKERILQEIRPLDGLRETLDRK